MPWMRFRLRDNEVWARVDGNGAPLADGGRVDVVYKAAPGAKVYRAATRNLTPLGGEAVEIAVEATPAASTGSTSQGKGSASLPSGSHKALPPPSDAVLVWTDGACSGNPGPAGLGVVVIDGKERREISEYLGEGTNNIAELTAIERGLAAVTHRDRPVYVYTDSKYSIGVLSLGWKAKANQELIARIRKLAASFAKLTFVKVAGHAGIPDNERCDQLAVDAVRRRA